VIAAKDVLNVVHHKLAFERRARVLSQVFAKILPPNSRILDVGTGDGSIANLIMEQRSDLVICGVDVLLRPKTCIPVELFDGRRLPFPNESFDCVMFVDVLHHTKDPAMGVVEASRVSKCHVVIKDHLLDGSFSQPVLRLMDWIGNRGHGVALPYNYLSESQWKQIFSDTCLSTELWIERLGLYPAPASWLFGDGLHFVTRLIKSHSVDSVRARDSALAPEGACF
jgi:ubiquinone/menaquinone biosynthesis C-methylase UbiE